jgi:hypothetical protein
MESPVTGMLPVRKFWNVDMAQAECLVFLTNVHLLLKLMTKIVVALYLDSIISYASSADENIWYIYIRIYLSCGLFK